MGENIVNCPYCGTNMILGNIYSGRGHLGWSEGKYLQTINMFDELFQKNNFLQFYISKINLKMLLTLDTAYKESFYCDQCNKIIIENAN